MRNSLLLAAIILALAVADDQAGVDLGESEQEMQAAVLREKEDEEISRDGVPFNKAQESITRATASLASSDNRAAGVHRFAGRILSTVLALLESNPAPAPESLGEGDLEAATDHSLKMQPLIQSAWSRAGGVQLQQTVATQEMEDRNARHDFRSGTKEMHFVESIDKAANKVVSNDVKQVESNQQLALAALRKQVEQKDIHLIESSRKEKKKQDEQLEQARSSIALDRHQLVLQQQKYVEMVPKLEDMARWSKEAKQGTLNARKLADDATAHVQEAKQIYKSINADAMAERDLGEGESETAMSSISYRAQMVTRWQSKMLERSQSIRQQSLELVHAIQAADITLHVDHASSPKPVNEPSTQRHGDLGEGVAIQDQRTLEPFASRLDGEVTWLRQQFERAANDIAYPRASKATQVADRVGATAAEADEIAHARYQHQRLHNLHQRFATALTNSLEGIREHAKAMRDTMLF